MTSFLNYYKRRATIREIERRTRTYNMEETILVITDMKKFEDDFFSYVKKDDYSSYLEKVEECTSNIDILLENYEKLQKLDINDDKELVDKIKNGITSMNNEIKSIKYEMIKKRLISIRANIESIVVGIL